MIKPDQLSIGDSVVVLWEANPKGHGTVKANRINGEKVSKIVLPDNKASGPKPNPGETWACRVVRITNKNSETRGAIVVKPVTLQIECTFTGVYVDPEKARLMSIVLQNREKNLFLEGDQGCGKSTISRAVAKELGWEFKLVSCGLIKKFIYMHGRYLPKAEGDRMGFVWTDSPLTQALREANSKPNREFLVMFDEYTRMDEDARDALLDVIEGKVRELRLVNGDVVPVPPNVHFMAAGNAGSSFTVKREDAAAKDRWVILKVEYMPQTEEIAHCLSKFEGCPRKEMEMAITIINSLRELRFDARARLSKAVSTRAAENVAMLLANGINLETALETAVTNQYSGSASDHTTEAGVVAKAISEKLAQLRSR